MKILKLLLIAGFIFLFTCGLAFSQTKLVMNLSSTAIPDTGDTGRRTIDSLAASQDFWVKVYLLNVTNLVGYQVKFSFDKTKLDWTGTKYHDNDPFTAEINPLTTNAEVKTLNSDSTTYEMARSRGQNGTAIAVDTMWIGTIKFTTKSTFSLGDSTKFTWQLGKVEWKGQADLVWIAAGNMESGSIKGTPETSVPVEMSQYTATAVEDNSVSIEWKTESEINNYGFEIQRSTDNTNFAKIAFVEGNGTTSISNAYSFIDNSLPAGDYYYRIKQIDFNGQFKYTDVIEVTVSAPEEYRLHQNYPNPFNPETNIMFALKEPGNVSLKVFSVTGQEVSDLADGNMGAGSHTVTLNASDFVSGIYFYVLKVNDFISVRKMLLLK